MNAKTFTLKDLSSKPYAWILEGVDLEVIDDAVEYIETYVKGIINGANYGDYGDQTDDELYTEWRESDEFEEVVEFVRQNKYASMPDYDAVMTAGEIVKLYGLDESTVRQAIYRGLPARRSGGTWLVLRSVAEARWGNRAKSVATMLVAAIWLTAAILGMTL